MADRVPELRLLIDGDLVATTDGVPVIDPATGVVTAEAPRARPEHVERVMSAMLRAAPAWAADPAARAGCLLAAAEVIDAHSAELAALVVRELGAVPASALFQPTGLAGFFRYYAAQVEPECEVLSDDGTARVVVLRRPVGPVVAIPPWNGPLYMAAMKIAPALAAGNPVVLKPSPYTPLATLRAGALLAEVFPPGVLNVLSGGDDLGPALTAHPVPRMLTFTGSIRTGRLVAAAAAADLKRCVLELGGNDAAVVLDDADVEHAVTELFRAGFHNCGQVCVAPKRVFVHESIYADVVDGLSTKARAVQVGRPDEDGTELGPVQNDAQLRHVIALVTDARDRGARIVAGGRRLDQPGYFYAPTIVAGAEEGMRVVDEEQFGPVMPVIPFSDTADAVRRANATTYGLGASVWSSDGDRADDVAGQLEAGQVWINTHQATLGPAQPVVGIKHSGLGVEKGTWGLNQFTDLQVRYTTRAAAQARRAATSRSGA